MRYTISIPPSNYGVFDNPEKAKEALLAKGWKLESGDPLYNDWTQWIFILGSRSASISTICCPFEISKLPGAEYFVAFRDKGELHTCHSGIVSVEETENEKEFKERLLQSAREKFGETIEEVTFWREWEQ